MRHTGLRSTPPAGSRGFVITVAQPEGRIDPARSPRTRMRRSRRRPTGLRSRRGATHIPRHRVVRRDAYELGADAGVADPLALSCRSGTRDRSPSHATLTNPTALAVGRTRRDPAETPGSDAVPPPGHRVAAVGVGERHELGVGDGAAPAVVDLDRHRRMLAGRGRKDWRRVGSRFPAGPSPRDASFNRLCQVAANARQTPPSKGRYGRKLGICALAAGGNRVSRRTGCGAGAGTVARNGARTCPSARRRRATLRVGDEVVVLVGIRGEVEELARRERVLVDDELVALGLERRRSPSSR